jgi:hypothetical protein
MSSFSIVHDTSLELRRQVFEALRTTVDVDFALGDDLDRITLQPPGDTLDDSAIASLYLYHVDLNQHLRNQPPLPDRAADDLFRRPPLPLQLRYLFTPVDADDLTNQLLLGRLLQHFHDFPSFATLSGEPIGDSHGGASRELRVRPDLLSIEQLAQLWNALSTPYRVAVSLMVEVLAVDSAQPPARRPRTEALVTVIGRGGRPS